MELWRSTAAVAHALDLAGPSQPVGRSAESDPIIASAFKGLSHARTEATQRWNAGVDYVFIPVIQELARRGL